MVFFSSSTSPLRVDGDLLRQVALGDRRRDVGDVAHLRGQVVREQVHVVGQIAPDAGGVGHLGLTAELAVGADLLRDARDLGGERAQLIDHAVDGGADAQELALDRLPLDLERHLLREVALGDRADDARDLGGRLHQVADERVDGADAGAPAAAHRASVARSVMRPSRPTTRSTRTISLAIASLSEMIALNSCAMSGISEPVGGASPAAHRQAYPEIALPNRAQRVQQLAPATRPRRDAGAHGARRALGRRPRRWSRRLAGAAVFRCDRGGRSYRCCCRSCPATSVHVRRSPRGYSSPAPRPGRSSSRYVARLRLFRTARIGPFQAVSVRVSVPLPSPWTDPPGGVGMRAAEAAARSAARRRRRHGGRAAGR